jgi:hypothetical protein
VNDVRTLFESVLTDPPPDTLDLDRVVARGTRRRTVRRAVAAAAGLAAALVIGTGAALVATPGDTDTAPPATDPTTVEPTPPTTAAVSCTPQGIEVTPTTISAQPFGVVLVLSSTMAAGSYLTRSTGDEGGSAGESGSGGGDPLPRSGTGTLTLETPPGTLTLACETPSGEQRGDPVELTVVDPKGYWRGDVETGCTTATTPSWKATLVGEGKTPEQAVQALVAAFLADDQAADFEARPADAGYRDGNTQTWLLGKGGDRHATIVVVAEGQGIRYRAVPDILCTS